MERSLPQSSFKEKFVRRRLNIESDTTQGTPQTEVSTSVPLSYVEFNIGDVSKILTETIEKKPIVYTMIPWKSSVVSGSHVQKYTSTLIFYAKLAQLSMWISSL